jgi:hypothetical protein
MLSRGVARPDALPEALHLESHDGPYVACRLLQPTSIREHNRRILRTPRTAPAVARERSCFSNRPP